MKRFISISLILLVLLNISVISFADNSFNEDLKFKSKEDIIVQPMDGSREYTVTEHSRMYLYKEFVRYLSPSWVKTDRYIWSESNTSGINYSGNLDLKFAEKAALKLGLSISRTTSYSVAIHIPADQTKFSKLAYYSDYYLSDVTVKEIYYDGRPSIVKRGYIYTPLEDTYLDIVYQN